MRFSLICPYAQASFHAPSLEIAGCICMALGPMFGAEELVPEGEDREGADTPVMLGWAAWADKRNITEDFFWENRMVIADALDSMRIGTAYQTADIDDLLSRIPEVDAQEWLAAQRERNAKHGDGLFEMAKKLAENFRTFPREKFKVAKVDVNVEECDCEGCKAEREAKAKAESEAVAAASTPTGEASEN